MKILTKCTGLISMAVIATVMLGTLFATEVSAKTFQVDLKMNDEQTELMPSGRGNCARSNHKGCVQADKHQSANIKFVLRERDKDCNQQAGAKWQLSAVYLGGKESDSKPDSWGSLDAEVVADFNVADAASGLLNHTEVGTNHRKIYISNENKHKYSIWYTVVASCVDGAGTVLGTLKVDPRVRNVGD